MTEQPTNGLAAALAELQTQLPRIGKSKTANTGTYSYSYTPLEDITAAIMPLLGKLGMSFSTWPTMSGDRFVLAYRLWHWSGDHISGEYPLPTSGGAQAIGSAITYARRYTLCAVTGISPDADDDGAAAHAATQQESAARPTQRRQSAHTAKAGARPAGGDVPITKPQLGKLRVLLGKYGLGDNRDGALAYYAETIGREIESTKDLTKAEASKVIDRLDKELDDSGEQGDPWPDAE